MNGHAQDCSCFGCRVRTIQFVTPPSRRNNIPPRQSNNSWERGIVKDSRGMPICIPGTCEPIPIKQYGEKRREIEAERRRMLTDPNYGKVS